MSYWKNVEQCKEEFLRATVSHTSTYMGKAIIINLLDGKSLSQFAIKADASEFHCHVQWKWINETILCTGWPKSKFANSNGCNSLDKHFWPHVGKAKMCLAGVSLFWFFSCLFTIFSCLFTIFKINVHLSNAFWLYQHRVRNAYFQRYNQKKFYILIWVTLYVGHSGIFRDFSR